MQSYSLIVCWIHPLLSQRAIRGTAWLTDLPDSAIRRPSEGAPGAGFPLYLANSEPAKGIRASARKLEESGMLREGWMNVVWIVVDCLRQDRLGVYGYPRVTTPHLDRLATQGVRFDQCISPHIPTQPAHTTFFTGKDVFAHEIVAQGGKQELDLAVRLLPDLLREHGY